MALGAAVILAGLLAPALPQALREGPRGDSLRASVGVPAAELARVASPGVTRIRIHGGAELRVLTRRALDRLFATRIGARVRERLDSGALAGPVTIELNLRGDDFTPDRVPGE